MGFTKSVIDDVIGSVQDLFSFVVGLALVMFILGEFYGSYFRFSNVYWYPAYILGAMVVMKVLKDVVKKYLKIGQ